MSVHSSRTSPHLVWLTAILAWVGLLVCLLLVQESSSGGMRICPVGSGCQAVLSSRYAFMFGISLSWLGALFYAGLLVICLAVLGIGSPGWRQRLVSVALFASVAGVSFTAGLMYLQIFVIHAFCSFCMFSAGIQVALLVALSMAVRSDLQRLPASPAVSVALLVSALFGSLAVLWPMLAARNEIVAQVGARQWSRFEMEQDLRGRIWPLKREISDREAAWVQRKIDEEVLALEARKRGLTVDALLAQFAADRLQQLEILRRDYAAKSFLSKPRGPLSFKYDVAQALGPTNASVEIVVFSDFTCDYCIQLDGVLRRIRNEFPQIRIAYCDFPLRSDGPGMLAAVAGKCAAEQGRFWEYHDRLFDEKGTLPKSKLTSIARELRMDEVRFAQCLGSQSISDSVRAGCDEAIALGIVGAPAIFVNGELVGGMVDYVTLRGKIVAILGRDADPAKKR